MKLHPRMFIVAGARNRISTFVTQVWEKEALTPIEVVSILTTLAADYAKYPLRDERHPGQPDKKADEE